MSAQVLFAAPETRTFAFVARGDNSIDALAAAPIAGRLNAPVLLTTPPSLSQAASDALEDIKPDVVVVAGGTGAVSSAVYEQIIDLLPSADVRRVSGKTRYETAAALSALIGEYDASFLVPGDAAEPPAMRTETLRCDRYDFVSAGLVPTEPWFTNVGSGDGTYGALHPEDGGVFEDLGCALHLPEGATVTGMRALYLDHASDSRQGDCTFWDRSASVPPRAPERYIVVPATTDAFDGGPIVVEAPTFEPFTVRSDMSYEVYCRTREAGYINGLVHFEVTYQVPRVPGTAG